MKFIILTSYDTNKKVAYNVDKMISFEEHDKASAVTYGAGHASICEYVKESFNEILEMLKG